MDVADSTLTRVGIGTTSSPYSVKLNLGNSNTWSASQTFNADSLFLGKVGIGTTGPSGILHILNSSANTVGPIVDVLSTGTAGTARGAARSLSIKAIGQSVLDFGAYPSSVYDPGLMIQTSDNSKFIFMVVPKNAGVNARVRTAATGLDYYVGGTTANNSTGTLSLSLDTNGRVGIGTTSPGEMFDIVGGNGRVQSGYNWLTSSDVRYKTNIITLSNTLAKINNLRGVSYDLKTDKKIISGHGKQIGFIAQELEKEYYIKLEMSYSVN